MAPVDPEASPFVRARLAKRDWEPLARGGNKKPGEEVKGKLILIDHSRGEGNYAVSRDRKYAEMMRPFLQTIMLTKCIPVFVVFF